jgi:hypothetical protein
MILGFDVLDAPIVVIISTIIPLTLSLGLVWQHLASLSDRVPDLHHHQFPRCDINPLDPHAK